MFPRQIDAIYHSYCFHFQLFLYEIIGTGNATNERDRKSMASDGDVIDDACLRLLHRRRIGRHQKPGWEVFNVSATVRRWVEQPDDNRGQ